MSTSVLTTADVRRVYGIGRVAAEELMRAAGAFQLGKSRAVLADDLEAVIRQRAEQARVAIADGGGG